MKRKENNFPRPFIKWAGGKNKVFPHILELIKTKKFRYYEPFLGGGSVFFNLYKLGYIEEAYLNDANHELINSYEVIKNNVSGLLEELSKKKYKNSFDSFLKIRKTDPNKLSKIERAARFIFLNKTCFNGLYRVNKKNEFNVPYGKYKNPVILDEKNAIAASEALQIATLSCSDFGSCLNPKPGDVVYFDPPYLPVNKNSFTEYTGGGFSYSDHERLANIFSFLLSQGVTCILSNSYSEKTIELYGGEKMNVLSEHCAISGHSDSRKITKEILVY